MPYLVLGHLIRSAFSEVTVDQFQRAGPCNAEHPASVHTIPSVHTIRVVRPPTMA